MRLRDKRERKCRARRGLESKRNRGRAFGASLKEMIESNLVQSGGRSKRGNVPANAFLNFIGPYHHGEAFQRTSS